MNTHLDNALRVSHQRLIRAEGAEALLGEIHGHAASTLDEITLRLEGRAPDDYALAIATDALKIIAGWTE